MSEQINPQHEDEDFKRRLNKRQQLMAERKENLLLALYVFIALMIVLLGLLMRTHILMVFAFFALGLPIIQLLERRSRRRSQAVYLEQDIT